MKKLFLFFLISMMSLHAQQPHNEAFKAECHTSNADNDKRYKYLNHVGANVSAYKAFVLFWEIANQGLEGVFSPVGLQCIAHVAETGNHIISGYKNSDNCSYNTHQALIGSNLMFAVFNIVGAVTMASSPYFTMSMALSAAIQVATAYYKKGTEKK